MLQYLKLSKKQQQSTQSRCALHNTGIYLLTLPFFGQGCSQPLPPETVSPAEKRVGAAKMCRLRNYIQLVGYLYPVVQKAG